MLSPRFILPDFLVATMHSGDHSPGLHQAQIHPLDHQIVKRDNPLQKRIIQVATCLAPLYPMFNIEYSEAPHTAVLPHSVS